MKGRKEFEKREHNGQVKQLNTELVDHLGKLEHHRSGEVMGRQRTRMALWVLVCDNMSTLKEDMLSQALAL